MKIKILFFSITALLIISTVSCSKDETVEKSPILQKNALKLEVAFPNVEGELITLNSGVVIEKKGEHYILGGDVLLSNEQIKLLDETGSLFPVSSNTPIDSSKIILIDDPASGVRFIYKGKGKLKAVGRHPYENKYWAMVRYTFHPNLNPYTKQTILKAIQHYESETNVRFYNATGEPTSHPTYGFKYPYVEFINGNGNSSFVGRIGGKQNLTLTTYASRGTAIHEIGHAIGLYHEHCRNDRDSYIIVNSSNIKPDKRHNFNKITRNYYSIGSLDWNSIMLYPSMVSDPDFVYNTTIPVMTKKDGSMFTTNRISLSEMDKRWANTFYVPYIARQDICTELAKIVYKSDNSIMSPTERMQLMRRLNQGRGDCYYKCRNW